MISLRNPIKRVDSIFTLFTILGLSLFSATIPMAMAAPDPGLGGTPGTIVISGTTTIGITASSAIPQSGTNLRVYDQPAAPFDDDVCPTPSPGVVGDLVPSTVDAWELRNALGTIPVRYYLPTAGSSVVSAPFGTGIGASTTVTTAGGALVTTDGSDPATFGISGPVAATWTPVVGGPGATANTDRLGGYRMMTCGTESGFPGTYEVIGGFQTSPPVAGEIIPINTTALLIAGISNQTGIMMALMTVATISFVILKFQVLKKSN